MELRMQPIRAGFATREQAESVMRKLASLRGEAFRLENVGDGFGRTEPEHEMAMLDSGYNFLFWEDPGGAPAPDAGSYVLSANVPAAALAQARTVIEEAGGRLT